MTDPCLVRAATVWKSGKAAARLSRSNAGVRFSYLPQYNGPQVATTLPHGFDQTLPEGALPPFLAGMLPEGHRLLALQRAIKASADDDLTLLRAFGEATDSAPEAVLDATATTFEELADGVLPWSPSVRSRVVRELRRRRSDMAS